MIPKDAHFLTGSARLLRETTAGDFLTLAGALYSGKLLSKRSVEAMLKPGLGGEGCGVWTGDPKFGRKHYRTISRPGSIVEARGSFYNFTNLDNSKWINIVILGNTIEDSGTILLGVWERLCLNEEVSFWSPLDRTCGHPLQVLSNVLDLQISYFAVSEKNFTGGPS